MLNLCSELQREAPGIVGELNTWTAAALESGQPSVGYPSVVVDPIWGEVPIVEHENWLLSRRLLRRLAGLWQLGMAWVIFPNATHTRLQHSVGVLSVAEHMMHGKNVSVAERIAIRLAALLHDVGHGPLSHASERLLLLAHQEEGAQAESICRRTFFLRKAVPPAELASALIVASAWGRIAKMLPGSVDSDDVGKKTMARVLGSEAFTDHPLLSGIISGKCDADRIDYVIRDANYTRVCDASEMQRFVINDSWEQVDACLHSLRTVLYDRVYHAPKVQFEEARFRRHLVSQSPFMRLTDFMELPSDSELVDLSTRSGFASYSHRDHGVQHKVGGQA